MKFVKLSVLALTLGMFIASCGNSETEAPKADTTVAPTTAPMVDTTHPAAMPADTAAKAMDTTHKM